MSPSVDAFYLEGLLLGLGLFAAPGPKDTLVIRQSMSGGATWGVVAICVLADVVLIAIGVAGAGAMLVRAPQIVSALLLAGALYLLWFGGQRLHAAVRNRSMPGVTELSRSPRELAVSALGLGFCNPYAWLDTVVLIGTIGGAKPQAQQAAFAGGAMTASLLWFIALALGSGRLTFLFRSPAAWRVLDVGVALLMAYLATGLVLEFVGQAQG
jgi:L-lysine exporter family protein LysE/ArgO